MEKTLIPEGLTDAVELSPLELNAYRFTGAHTPLTPDQLRKDETAPATAPAAAPADVGKE